MKIVQTNKAYYPLIGGMETVVKNLCEGLAQIDTINIEAIVCNTKRTLFLRKENVRNVPVVYVPTWTRISSLPISPMYPFHLSQMRGDILHIHEPFPLADISFLLIPHFQKRFTRIVVSWHSDIVRQQWALKIYRPFLKKFLESVDKIIVSAPALIDNSEFLSGYRNKCEVIPLGLDIAWSLNGSTRKQRVNQIRNKYSTPILLFVGRLVYYKGIQYLIEAMKVVPDAALIIIGYGPLENQIKKQIKKLHLQGRVQIIPFLADEELHAFYEACDLFVLPSTERSEAFGLVQVEAMACAKPIISTELGTGTSFVNQHNVTGLVVPPKNTQVLAEAIIQLLGDETLRSRLGNNAQERAFQEFTVEKMVHRTYEIYKALLSE